MSDVSQDPDYESTNIIRLDEKLGDNRPPPGIGPQEARGIGSGGGGMDGLDGRLRSVEVKVEAIVGNLSDLRSDFRLAIGAGVGAAIGLAGMVIVSYLMLAGQMESNRKEMAELIRFETGRISPPASASPSPETSP
jgi:hypothetical protein